MLLLATCEIIILERPREFLSPIRSNDRQSRTIRSQVVIIVVINNSLCLARQCRSGILSSLDKSFLYIFAGSKSRILVSKKSIRVVVAKESTGKADLQRSDLQPAGRSISSLSQQPYIFHELSVDGLIDFLHHVVSAFKQLCPEGGRMDMHI